MDELPLVMLTGLALRMTTGMGGGGVETVTVADFDTLPPAPEHVSE